MLPLHHTPKERHIKLFLYYNTVIGTRLWRPLLYQLSYTPIYAILSTYLLYMVKIDLSRLYSKKV